MNDVVKVKFTGIDNPPEYATPGSAGCDLCSQVNVLICPHETILIPTGLRIQLPDGYEAQVRPRSGLALKHDLTVLNAPGTIDNDFTGEIGVIMHNASDTPYRFHVGDRIAQLVVAPVTRCVFEKVDELSPTVRGGGGYGSTGT